MPIEVMAARGMETLAYGPMKPVGLRDPRTGKRPYAVIQLRQDNALATLFNMVGFQTKLKHGEQIRIFRTIPGLEDASFARLGVIHRNTFINAPRLLDSTLRLKNSPRLRFAGPDHRMRRIRRKCGHRPTGWTICRGTEIGRSTVGTASNNSFGRAPRAYYRRRHRRNVSTYEHQLWSISKH